MKDSVGRRGMAVCRIAWRKGREEAIVIAVADYRWSVVVVVVEGVGSSCGVEIVERRGPRR